MPRKAPRRASKPKLSKVPKKLLTAFHAAKSARSRAYCTYSGCGIGAAVVLANGKIYSGCNVENASYGATICAERTAIHTAVSTEKTLPQIVAVVVVTDSDPPWFPCGLCRQVISEFTPKDAKVYCSNLQGRAHVTSLTKLLPYRFKGADLAQNSL